MSIYAKIDRQRYARWSRPGRETRYERAKNGLPALLPRVRLPAYQALRRPVSLDCILPAGRRHDYSITLPL
jgi:hypothetical protein